MSRIEFRINGHHLREHDASPATTVLDYLRDNLGLMGTKEGCAEGDCGACTVLLLDRRRSKTPRWLPVNSCLLPLAAIHGRDLVTIEGLGTGGAAHPAQQAAVATHASQCGYCTPGVVLTLAAAAHCSASEFATGQAEMLAGNLCRCTGYGPIRAALAEVAASDPDDSLKRLRALPELTVAQEPLEYCAGGVHCVIPVTWEQLWEAIEQHPNHSLVAGATDWILTSAAPFWEHVGGGSGQSSSPCMLSLERLPEFCQVRDRGETGWWIGAGVRVADLQETVGADVPAVARLLRYFGSAQIRNRGTIGGNLCTASPVGDLAPLLLALDAKVVLRSRRGDRMLLLNDFFRGYRRTALRPGEVLAAIELPRPRGDTRISPFKVCKRREVDIATLSCVVAVDVGADNVMRRARVAFGGMAPTPLRVAACERELEGKVFSASAFRRAAEATERELEPISDVRGSAWYRRRVAKNLVQAFHAEWETGEEPAWRADHPGTVALAPGAQREEK